jgi:hypothetical protein
MEGPKVDSLGGEVGDEDRMSVKEKWCDVYLLSRK